MNEPDRFLRLPQVTERVGLGKTMIYKKMREQTFPQKYKPGGAASRWSEREVTEWMDARRVEREAGTN